MRVGVLSVKLFIRNSYSLKDKRQSLKSLKDRIRNKFNVAVAEVDCQDVWQTAVVGIVTVSNSSRFVNSVISKVIDFIRVNKTTDLVDYEHEIL